MKKLRFIFLITLMFGGGLSAQWGDCNSFDLRDVYSVHSGEYQDISNDGCRDDIWRWVVWFNTMQMTGSPSIPNGAYHRVKAEILGNNTRSFTGATVLKTVELHPDNFYDVGAIAVPGGGSGFYHSVHWNPEDEPVPYRYGFMRVTILTYVWHNYGPGGAGEYIGFGGTPCESPIYFLCAGAGYGDPGGGGSGEPDIKAGNANLQSSGGTTFIDGVGTIVKLRSGDSFNYNVLGQNDGQGTASSFNIQTYVNTTNSYTPPATGLGPAVGSIQYVGSLSPGASVSHNQTDWVDNHSSKFNASGYRYFHTYFDANQTVPETNESNNGVTQLAYYYHAGDAEPDNNEGRIVLNHLNVANEISFLYQMRNPLTNQMESQIGNGLQLSIYPALTGPMQLQPAVFQTTVTQKDNQIDISSLPAGAYRVVINGHYIKRFLAN